MSWISGNDNCKQFADGTLQTPSKACYLWVFLLVIGAVLQVQYVKTNPMYAVPHTIVSGGLIYVMAQNCAKCNGWRGFWLTMAIGIVAGMLIHGVVPTEDQPHDADVPSQRPSRR